MRIDVFKSEEIDEVISLIEAVQDLIQSHELDEELYMLLQEALEKLLK